MSGAALGCRHCHKEKARRWFTFPNNHREVIAAFDFFTVPTLRFRILYCFFVIEAGPSQDPEFSCHRASDQ
jgi:hypothetical protein